MKLPWLKTRKKSLTHPWLMKYSEPLSCRILRNSSKVQPHAVFSHFLIHPWHKPWSIVVGSVLLQNSEGFIPNLELYWPFFHFLIHPWPKWLGTVVPDQSRQQLTRQSPNAYTGPANHNFWWSSIAWTIEKSLRCPILPNKETRVLASHPPLELIRELVFSI